MAAAKGKKKQLPRPDRWSVGIDPGLGTTALVLLADRVPIAAQAARDKTTRPDHFRMHRMSLWLRNTIQSWIHQYEIDVLHVVIEKAYLNDAKRGVTTLAKQMHMHGVYLERLYELEDCDVYVGEVVNTTAKKMFTGNGNATKAVMVHHSAWRTRNEMDETREHLADAQGIGTCYPTMENVDPTEGPANPFYTDGNIGQGPDWK